MVHLRRPRYAGKNPHRFGEKCNRADSRKNTNVGPLRDLIYLLLFVSSFFVTTVSRRGQRWRLHSDEPLCLLRTSGL